MADRHDPEDKPINFRLYDSDLRAWLLSESARRGISRSALIVEALAEKRQRESAGARRHHAASRSSR